MTKPADDVLMDGELSLNDLDGEDNAILRRVADRLGSKEGPKAASHSSHSSSSGRGHSSYVNGRFEDDKP